MAHTCMYVYVFIYIYVYLCILLSAFMVHTPPKTDSMTPLQTKSQTYFKFLFPAHAFTPSHM